MDLKYQGLGEEREYLYKFRDRLTGQEFLDLRQAQDGKDADVTTYLATNLNMRLVFWDRDEFLDEKNLLALGMDVYHVLYNVALRLEGEELKEAQTFLAQFWGISLEQVVASLSNGSSESVQDGSGLPSSEPTISPTPSPETPEAEQATT
jgi:hypothetical protein